MVADNETVQYDIRIQAEQALSNLAEISTRAQTVREKLYLAEQAAKNFAAGSGLSLRNVASLFKELDSAQMENAKDSQIFGQNGARAWNDVGNAASTGSGKVIRSIDGMRIALGALTAMLVFTVIQAFQRMFQGALKGLVEIEAAMFNIVNAEKKLSEQGVDISVKGLQQLIKDLKELDPMLSEFQATELISTIATKVAPAFGFGTKEIERMAKSVTILAVRNQALGKSFEEVEQQVITGILSGKVTQGINQLGLKITDQIVKEEAVNIGLVKNAKAYDDLNAKAQERINVLTILSILEKDTAEEAKNIPSFLQSASGLIGTAKAEFQDLLTSLGQKFAPVLKEILKGIISFLERINQSLVENEDAWNSVVALLVLVSKFVFVLIDGFLNLSVAIGKAGKKLFEILGALPLVGGLIKKLFPNVEYADTPTGAKKSEVDQSDKQASEEKNAKAIADSQKKIQDALKDSDDKKLDIERDYQRKLYDINRDFNYKLEDIARNTAQKQEDALRNYNQKVEDINRTADQKIAEAEQEEQKKQLDREAQFQQRLKELREKFLFDLEDALRERDARQVLKLIRQYNMDKKNLEDRHKLEQQQAKKDLTSKLADIERERQLKLEAAKREYDDKLKEIAIGEARERAEANLWLKRQLEDARLWHQRQLEEQRQYLQRKLRDIADALKAEYNMTAAGAQAMTNLMAATLSAQASLLQAFSSGLMTPINANGAITGGSLSAGNTFPSYSSTFSSLTSGQGYGLAEGGTLLATRPTKAIFGENGPERVDVTPLGKPGNNVGNVFGDKSAMGLGGSVKIALELSPDLEARIVENSLDGMAVTLERVIRSKS